MKFGLWFVLFPALAWASELTGAVDFHVHTAPDVVARSVDGLEAVRMARASGLRAIVLKNHYEPTASWAYFANKAVPGIDVFGGIALNRPVGGVNPAAVSRMTQILGSRGKIVWLPTFDAENQVRSNRESRPWVAVLKGGRLLPEVLEVLDLIRKHGLVLATGHSSPAEVRLIIREARNRGIERIVVTHAMLPPVNMTVEEMKEAADAGAYVEFVYHGLTGKSPQWTPAQYARAMRNIGPERCIMASDLGQADTPLPAEGLRLFLEAMKKEGFSPQELRRMIADNPSRLLGLP